MIIILINSLDLQGRHTFSGEILLSFCVLPFWNGVSSERKDFAPLGSKIFPFIEDPFSDVARCNFCHGAAHLLSGLISTSNTLLGAILTLMHHQDVILKMRNEVYHVIGKDRLPTITDQSELSYCHAVLLEILRYTTVVPLVNHVW